MTFAGPRQLAPDSVFIWGSSSKSDRGSFGSILLNRLSICQHLLKINAEVQKLGQLFLLRTRFLARPIKAVV